MLRTARTENGVVQGLPAADPRITSYKGIPFAAPPTGENRWRAPQPCKSWDGVLKAYEFAPISVQDTPGLGNDIMEREWHVDSEVPMSEDCLYLNVWTPAKSPDEKLPVVVWFFGGGFQWGYTSEMEFDGERFARRGIVVVTVNYRLASLGFLAHPLLTAEQPDTPTNFGLLDQREGLKWTKRNIAAFGGDPDNITIAGQSAGGGSVMAHLTSPGSDGLFQKAIVHSALIRSPYGPTPIGPPETLEQAERKGEKLFSMLGVKTLEEARKLDPMFIRQKYAELRQTESWMFPVNDGRFNIGDSMLLFMQGKHSRVPVMTGNTADEFMTFIEASSENELEAKAKDIFGDRADEFLGFEESKRKLSDKMYAGVQALEYTAKALINGSREAGTTEDIYYYRFDTDIPGWDNPGNFHSVDLWFFFETLAKCWRPFKGAHYDLSRQMCNYWTNFVKSGNPNGNDNDGSPMPEWKPYTKDAPYAMNFITAGATPDASDETPFGKFLINKITDDIIKDNKE